MPKVALNLLIVIFSCFLQSLRLSTIYPDNMATDSLPDPHIIYKDLPLSDRVPQTRFFKLEAGDWDDQIRCTLTKEGLSTRPTYDAISYAWGETAGENGPPAKEIITINNYGFEISVNLAAALRHFRKSYPDKLLWADVISHNQKDTNEMNKQVGRMREIYQRCQAVRIWLGKESRLAHPAAKATAEDKTSPCVWSSGSSGSNPEKPPSDQSYEENEQDKSKVKQYKKHFYNFYNLPTALQHNGAQDFRMGSFCLLHVLARDDHLNHQDLAFIQDLSSRDGVFEALAEMMNRTWWARQWVIQQTVLAEVATVHYGRFTIPWSMLTMALKTFQIHRQKACCTTEYAKLRTSDLKTLHHFAQTVRDIDTWRSIWFGQPNARIRLLPLLWQFRQRETGRLPDKIYALLPLVKDWGSERAIEVHYDWDVAHIYADLVRQLVDVHDSLLPLMGTTRKSLELASSIPSWAPDWSVQPDAYELARLERTLLYKSCGEKVDKDGNVVRDDEYQAMLKFGVRPNVRFYEAAGEDRFQFLELRGKLHDKISDVGRVMPQNDDGAVRETFAQWSQIAFSKADPVTEYVNGKDNKAAAYWRTLCMDTEYIGREADEDNLPLHKQEYQRASKNYAMEYVDKIKNMRETGDSDQNSEEDVTAIPPLGSKRTVTWRPPRSPEHPASPSFRSPWPSGPARRTSTMKSDDEVDEIKKINETVQSATTDRRFFITEQGYMGLGPKEMKPGDEIAVLVGGHTPFVLRRAGEKVIGSAVGIKQCYTLVGDCYVHGLMDGEAFADIDNIEQVEKMYLE